MVMCKPALPAFAKQRLRPLCSGTQQLFAFMSLLWWPSECQELPVECCANEGDSAARASICRALQSRFPRRQRREYQPACGTDSLIAQTCTTKHGIIPLDMDAHFYMACRCRDFLSIAAVLLAKWESDRWDAVSCRKVPQTDHWHRSRPVVPYHLSCRGDGMQRTGGL